MALPIEVVCDWYKWPATPYRRTPMHRLGEDDFGTWLYAPRGAAATYEGRGAAPLPVSFLSLVPARSEWWIATWMRDNDEIKIDLYVDIVCPPEWVDDRLQIVDLDLDVIRLRDGEVFVDDEDEFESHSVDLGYPPGVVDGARHTAQKMLAAVREGSAPLDRPPSEWLAAGRAALGRVG